MSNLIEFRTYKNESNADIAEEIVLCNDSALVLKLAEILLHPVAKKVLVSSAKSIQKAFGEEISLLKEENVDTCPLKNHLRTLLDDEDLVDYVYALIKYPKFKSEQIRDFNDFFKYRVKAVGDS